MVGGGWCSPGARLFRAPIWCPTRGGGKREAGGTVAESLAATLSGGYAPDSARAEGSSIVDEPGEY